MAPIVLVHANPETEAVWDLVAARLPELGHDEPARLSPSGFGVPVPTGFAANAEAYRAWLIGELERIGEQVDVVGQDWGAAATSWASR